MDMLRQRCCGDDASAGLARRVEVYVVSVVRTGGSIANDASGAGLFVTILALCMVIWPGALFACVPRRARSRACVCEMWRRERESYSLVATCARWMGGGGCCTGTCKSMM